MILPEPVARIVAFLEDIGIAVAIEPVADDSFLPDIAVRDGALVFDPRLRNPGDLLHEAGHIAVTDPEQRATLCQVPADGGDELAAIAWSYAAALAAGVDPALVFHADGYRGGGGYLIAAMEGGGPPGLPLLQYYGMTASRRDAAALGRPVFPQMARWLR